MALITWVGKPDHWTPPEAPVEEARWVLAAEEDALPEVAQLPDNRHISIMAALKTVDRYLLRKSLSGEFNPDWADFEYHRRIVVKAPASSGSSGIHLLDIETPENPVARLLRMAGNYPGPLRGVVEEFIEGDAIELSGVKLAGRIYFFHPLRQHWSPDWSRIERYERVFDYWWLYKWTANALYDVGLDDSAFCVEWRVTGYQQAKVIEINPRPGDDDKGYFEALWDRPIAEQIEEWAITNHLQDIYLAESPETAQATAQAVHA